MKILKIASNLITLYRGISSHNRKGSYYSIDKEFARLFTQSGRDKEIETVRINDSDIYKKEPLPLATNENSFDEGLKEAIKLGFKAFMLDEGIGQPNSVYVIDKSCIVKIKTAQVENNHIKDTQDLINLFTEKYGKNINNWDWTRVSQYQYLTEDFIRKFKDYVDWLYISKTQKLSEDFIREFEDKIRWFYISRTQTLSEPFIREFKDKVNWFYISKFQKLSEDFIREFKDYVDWNNISYYQILSESLIREFKDKVIWNFISSSQRLSDAFLEEFKDKINWNSYYLYNPYTDPRKRIKYMRDKKYIEQYDPNKHVLQNPEVLDNNNQDLQKFKDLVNSKSDNWYKECNRIKRMSTSGITTMYHHTNKNMQSSIEKNGLLINQSFNKTTGAQSEIRKIYKMNPIFLSLTPYLFKEWGDITFIVDVTGLNIVADIPSLVDRGAYYGDTGDCIWFRVKKSVELFNYIDENGALYYSDLLDSDSPVAIACINLTRTGACLQNIPPERIKVFNE